MVEQQVQESQRQKNRTRLSTEMSILIAGYFHIIRTLHGHGSDISMDQEIA